MPSMGGGVFPARQISHSLGSAKDCHDLPRCGKRCGFLVHDAYAIKLNLKVKHQTMTDIPQKDYAANSRRMAVKQKGGRWAPHAVRLRVIRCALFGDNSSQFARRLGVSAQRLGNMENGFPLSIDFANKIRLAAPGITLDWLYHGEERAVPLEMLTRLREEAAKPEHNPPV